ncbi:hypothetical protein N8Z59_02320 [Planktomarina temperata]|nr:hypothetical protein [Planktomarina temperata]
MAVNSIQNVGGLKGGDTGCVETKLKHPQGKERAPKANSTQTASSKTRQKSSCKLSAHAYSSLNHINTDHYVTSTSVPVTVEVVLPAKMAAIMHAIPFPSPHTFQHHNSPQNYFPEFHQRISDAC